MGFLDKLLSYPANRCLKIPCKLSQSAFEWQTKLKHCSGIALTIAVRIAVREESVMKTKVWTRPEVKEIRLGCEINSYAPAEI